MRAILLIIILAIVALLAGVGTGFIDIDQTREAQAPNLSTTQNGVVAKGGQAPAFDVETGQVKVGAKDATVKVPAVEVVRPDEAAAANTGIANAQ